MDPNIGFRVMAVSQNTGTPICHFFVGNLLILDDSG